MHTNAARVATAYKQVQVNSRSPLELVVMLYDGAIASLGEARDALDRRDLATKARHFSKAFATVGELQATLNMDEGGEVAQRLDGLYTYVLERLTAANIAGDAKGIDEVVQLLTPLRDAWSEIASRPEAGR